MSVRDKLSDPGHKPLRAKLNGGITGNNRDRPPLTCRPIRLTHGNQAIPIIWRIPSLKHLLEGGVRIGLATGRSQCLLIVDPGKHDGLCPGVVAEEQTEPPSDLRASPMPIGWPKGVALAVLVPRGIAWIVIRINWLNARNSLTLALRSKSIGSLRSARAAAACSF